MTLRECLIQGKKPRSITIIIHFAMKRVGRLFVFQIAINVLTGENDMSLWTTVAANRAHRAGLEHSLLELMKDYDPTMDIENFSYWLQKRYDSGYRDAIELVNLYNEGY